MIAVIKGDIINSRSIKDPKVWAESVKSIFRRWGAKPKIWNIYGGDSFELEINEPHFAIREALRIKACIKATDKNIDVRMGIGTGEKTYDAADVTESNGPAFFNAGDAFEKAVKNKTNIEIITPQQELNDAMSVMMGLSLIVMDKWTVNTAAIIEASLEYPDLKQAGIAKKLGIKSQPEISQARKRGGYEEIMAMERFFRTNVEKQMNL